MNRMGWVAAILLAALTMPGSALAAPACQNTGNFERWLEDFKKEAAAEGIPRSAISLALDNVTLDPSVIRRDRGQGVFNQSFLQFSDRMTNNNRFQNGLRQMKNHANLLSRIEQRFGVPIPVVVSFWGLESDYGAYKGGTFHIIRAVATLAYDCRRSDFFRGQLKDAVRLVARGDLKPDEMIGNWAGELGPTQFTPSDYFKSGVDFDGDGRVDMIRSIPDALGSAANLMVNFGWRRGEPWLQEVRVPDAMPWEQADLAIQHPRSQWVKWGVRSTHGAALPADEMPASLVLPMGRLGPSFLAYQNFQAYIKWNSAIVYTTTAAYFATRFAGAPVLSRGNGAVEHPTTEQVRELQVQMIRQKIYSGEADGRLGSATRTAVRQAQLKAGLPADGYPSQSVIDRLLRGYGN
jgi:lytic murein transglycosylase